jgi:hypothetical protein
MVQIIPLKKGTEESLKRDLLARLRIRIRLSEKLVCFWQAGAWTWTPRRRGEHRVEKCCSRVRRVVNCSETKKKYSLFRF